jgi:streptogramin lyase
VHAAPPYAEQWSVTATPQDVEVDNTGRVWVSCADDSIRVYEPSGGKLLFAFGGTGTGDGEFQTPYGIAFDAAGNAYICDYAGSRLQKFTSAGAFLLAWPVPSTRVDHVAIDAAGDVYVTGYTDMSVHKYTSTGVPLLDWSSTNGDYTAGILVAGGIVYVSEWITTDVEQFTTSGTFLGSFPAQTLFGLDLEEDAAGQIWLADYSNNMVRVFTSDGTMVDEFGSAGNGNGQFNGVIGLAIGPDGSVYVSDEGNGRIQRFGDPITSVSETPASDAVMKVAAVPSPARGPVVITYSLARAAEVRVTVADAGGRILASLANGRASGGEHRVVWNARRAPDESRLPAGIYFVRVTSGTRTRDARVVLLD